MEKSFKSKEAALKRLKEYQNLFGKEVITGLVYCRDGQSYSLVVLYFSGKHMTLWQYDDGDDEGKKLFVNQILA